MTKIIEIPALLEKGDKVAVIAPSGRVNSVKTREAISIIESWGLQVIEGENLFKRDGIFAGTDKERLADLQSALDNQDIRAIFCARGGYGLSRIIDDLDYGRFSASPKWIVGYSDITVLHTEIIRRTGVPVLHAEMPLNYSSPELSLESL